VGIGLQGVEIEAYGVLLQQTADRLRLQLRRLPERPERLQPGFSVVVTLLEPGKLTLMRAKVLTVQEGTLDLTISQQLQTISCRRDVRYECVLPVSLRGVESSNASNDWLSVNAHNISMGGMYVITAEDQMIPDRLEVQLRLPETRSTSVLKTGSPTDGTMQISAHVKNRWLTKEGQAGIGIAFGTLLPKQERALAAYIKNILQQNQQAA
jgi:hypothetical protein